MDLPSLGPRTFGQLWPFPSTLMAGGFFSSAFHHGWLDDFRRVSRFLLTWRMLIAMEAGLPC